MENKEMNEYFNDLFEQTESLLQDWTYVDGIMKLIIKIINKSNNPMPTYAKYGDSGFDLRANISEDIILEGETSLQVILR